MKKNFQSLGFRSLFRFLFCFCFVFYSCWLGSALSWDKTGHRVVGQIAENHLTPKAKKGIEEILGKESLAEASTWADEIRSDHQWNYTHPWHYINLPPGTKFEGVKGKQLNWRKHRQSKTKDRGDIVRAILQFQEVLSTKQSSSKNLKRNSSSYSRDERQEALKFLIHFVGDLHQPLHAGYAEDKGGNDFTVTWFGQLTNLHQVWDMHLIDFQKLSFTEWSRFLDKASEQEIQEWQKAGVEKWVEESRELLQGIYPKGKKDLGYDYNFQHEKTLKKRLLQAGIRLAGVLNKAFEEI